MREVGELKVQLKLVEETRDNIRRDLIEANRRIREGNGFLTASDLHFPGVQLEFRVCSSVCTSIFADPFSPL